MYSMCVGRGFNAKVAKVSQRKQGARANRLGRALHRLSGISREDAKKIKGPRSAVTDFASDQRLHRRAKGAPAPSKSRFSAMVVEDLCCLRAFA
jgi:hypothetical protein